MKTSTLLRVEIKEKTAYYDQVLEYEIIGQDEVTDGNLVANLANDHPNPPEPLKHTSWINCKLSVIGTISDSIKTAISSKQGFDQFSSLGIDLIPDYLDDQVLFTESIHLGSISSDRVSYDGGRLLVKMASKIDVGRRRALQGANSTLTIMAFVSESTETPKTGDHDEQMDPQDFDGINPYKSLGNFTSLNLPPATMTNSFKKITTPSLPPIKKTAFASVPIEPLINASINVYHISSASSLLSIQVDTKSSHTVTIHNIQVDIPGALVTREGGDEMVVLVKGETMQYLYSVRLFDAAATSGAQRGVVGSAVRSLDVENTLRKSISFSICARTSDGLDLTSYFCARLAMNGEGGLQNLSVLANHGRLFEGTLTKLEVAPFVGLEFSLNVLPPIERHKVFSVQMLISNTGTRARSLNIRIMPATPSALESVKHKSKPDLFMDPGELIRAYQTELEIPATMICLESDVSLQSIPVGSCRLVMLHFIVIQGNVHSLPDIVVIDRESGKEYVLRETLQIYISGE